MWYRIEFNKDRSVKSCRLVEAVGQDGGRLVVYEDAPNDVTAIKQAVEYCKRRKEIQAKANKKRYESLKARGLCTYCTKPARKGKIRCAEHEAKHMAQNRRWNQRVAAGEDTSKATNNGGARNYQTSPVTVARRELELLRRVQTVFQSMNTLIFARWLESQIQEREVTAGERAA